MSDINLPNPPGLNDPDANKASEVVAWSSIMVGLSGIAVLLRFISQRLVGKKPTLDDWLAITALPFAWAMCFISIYGTQHNHFAQHIGQSTSSSLRHFLIGLWVFELMYNCAITLAKLSLITLWWRIFDIRSCHIALIVIGVLELMWLVATNLVLIFSCDPISGFWDLTIPSKCITQSQYWIGAAVPNITFDLALLILPNIWVMRLCISRAEKIALCSVFSLGVFVTVCSCLRLWQLILYNEELQTDIPWAIVGNDIWSVVEGNLSVVCCCLPSMRPLLRLLVQGRASSRCQCSNERPASSCHSHPNTLSMERISGYATKPERERARIPAWPLPNTQILPDIEKNDGIRTFSRTENRDHQLVSRNNDRLHMPPMVPRTWLQLEESAPSESPRRVSDLVSSQLTVSEEFEADAVSVESLSFSVRNDLEVSIDSIGIATSKF